MNIYTILVHGFSNCSAINIEKTRHQVLRTLEPKTERKKNDSHYLTAGLDPLVLY